MAAASSPDPRLEGRLDFPQRSVLTNAADEPARDLIAALVVEVTCPASTSSLSNRGIKIGIDGKGAWRTNVLVERLWRSVKYERSICTPTTASARHAMELGATSISIATDRTRRLTAELRTRCTSSYESQPPFRMAAKTRRTIHLSKRKTCPSKLKLLTNAAYAHSPGSSVW